MKSILLLRVGCLALITMSAGACHETGLPAETKCPSDFAAAVGKPCSPDGASCGGDSCTDSCQFCNILQCSSGVWTQLEAFPDPNCGADGGADIAGNACEVAGGYCALGDFVKPQCKVGYSEDDAITVCGMGICCVPSMH